MREINVPDKLIERAATAIDRVLTPYTGGLSGNQARSSARQALRAVLPEILAAELNTLISDPDNYTAGGAFRPIVLVSRRAELLRDAEQLAAVEPQPRLWQLTGTPSGPMPATRYREFDDRWQLKLEDGWIDSCWKSRTAMEAAGFTLAEVGDTQDGDQ